ncbi:MAG: hypothetical protein GXX96_08070 [Planctomycetaceae bacterium]|nr:hypothetical protein [Planctomycetaceae bacterium]
MSISDPVMKMGRDEMNLADFPLAMLATRPPKGVKSLVFEDEVVEKHGRSRVKRRLTVLACSEYGLPTASDDEVILGLIQLTYAAGFTDRKLSFTPAELFRVLGWRSEGRSYSRLEDSLRRWVGVTLYYENAWRDNRLKTWMDEHFHLLDNVVIPRRHRRQATKACNGRCLAWTATWNETVFKSFQDGYIRKLDMGVLRRLRTSAARRMFRFLDKRFYNTKRLSFDVRTFACERVGFSRNYDNSQLKRKLLEGIRELERVGFLKSLPKEKRYRQVRRGRWEVLFIGNAKHTNVNQSVSTPLEFVLTERGVKRPEAAKLMREGSHETIRRCVREYDELLKSGRGANLGNPPGLLVKNIRERLAANKAGRREKDSTRTGRDCTRSRRTPTAFEPAESEAAESHTQLEAIRGHLAKLSLEERESLEADAMKAADPVRQAGYRRAESAGNSRLLAEYRNAIIESHVLRLLVGGAG